MALAEANPDGPLTPPGAVPSFAEVYERFFDFVWASTRRLGVGTEWIDDVVQEIFIVIHQRLHSLERPDSLRSWVYGITRRTVSTYHRARRSKGAGTDTLSLNADTLETQSPNPLELTEQNDQVKLLESLLAELAPPKREVFVLAEIEELSVPEIAEALEIPLNTAYSRLRAARQAFEAALARHTARSVRGKTS
ncbi:MAG TPA: sigma-70 family RNA polymerase sigma factor [Polyangiaceae bacterium]|nr:sigma-70 family RNA polymerase sigma factor [Polyangiaceae bacterium]